MRSRRVDARDVLDADATTSRAFSGRVVGVYRRNGPDVWDDYLLVDLDGTPIEVFAETPIQVETTIPPRTGTSSGGSTASFAGSPNHTTDVSRGQPGRTATPRPTVQRNASLRR